MAVPLSADGFPLGDRRQATVRLANIYVLGVTTDLAELDVSDTDILTVTVDVTAISGAGASLQVVLQSKLEFTSVWLPRVTPTALTAVGQQVYHVGLYAPVNNVPLGRILRPHLVIAGTTPSVTFTLEIVGK